MDPMRPSDPTARPHADGAPAPEASLVDEMAASIVGAPLIAHLGASRLPDRDAVQRLTDLLRDLAFPGFFGWRDLSPTNLRAETERLLGEVGAALEAQIRSVLRYTHDLDPERTDRIEAVRADRMAREMSASLLSRMPEVRRRLARDVQAAFDGDPASRHTDETIFCYPGIDAVFTHRVAHELLRIGVPLLPRIMQELAHGRTGIDIHPGAQIGESFFIDHGGGVVIGETSVIGDHVRIYQGVTLGAKSFRKDERGRLLRDGLKRHPTIGNRVTIYAGAVILGGDTVVGDDCVISGSVFLTESVPPGHVVRHDRPELVLRSHADLDRRTEGGG